MIARIRSMISIFFRWWLAGVHSKCEWRTTIANERSNRSFPATNIVVPDHSISFSHWFTCWHFMFFRILIWWRVPFINSISSCFLCEQLFVCVSATIRKYQSWIFVPCCNQAERTTGCTRLHSKIQPYYMAFNLYKIYEVNTP